MSAPEPTFPYPRLPLVDAIRILTIEPGAFGEALNCSLTAAAFSTKPRYAALSYTWDFPHPDLETLSQAISRNDASAPADAGTRHADDSGPQSDSHTTSTALTVNGHQFPIHANLWLCLMHLRSKTYPLPLWVDAVCINQVDGPERNAQVAIMSFIYSRAQKVIAWLGLRDINNPTHDSLRILAVEWREGAVQALAAAVVNGTKPRSSPAPAQNTFVFPRIATSAYWTRLWIVQEVCLARELVFVFGAKVWTFEDLEMWESLKHARNVARKAGTLRPTDIGNERIEARALLRIAEIRLFRHTDAMRFESLIERFANQACSEKRDRVYALLGLANDVRASIGDESNSNCVHDYSSSLDSPSSLSSEIPELKRGTGTIRVDYSRQYYDIWAQGVRVLYFRAKPMPGRIRGPDESLSRDERAITIVRTAGVIQIALDGKVEQELLKPIMAPQQGPVIRALGYLVGEITQLGPDYSSLIGSFRAQQDWLNCCEAYDKPQDLELIRTLNETYSTKIIGYGDKELSRIREIRNTTTVAWRRDEISLLSSWNSAKHIQNYTQIWSDVDKRAHGLPQEPKMCIGTERLIALVPRSAEVGDVVVRFWNCDAALVMRRVAMHVSPDADVPSSDLEYWMLVGRCDVADQRDRSEPSTDTWRFYIKATQEAKGAVWIDLDLRTLQLLTASIAIYEH
ncbi:heterokaryon incompatibility protein-domain-containing protein [Lasiosphaeria ovina]|uniref:Heterokaryon incompatibility protein-domain-containing protein n=1 Tax=Lasiosphaeria ovina TaxID=92902 RepID=A0AAE0N3J0_9PEZI|nr:heterokaryon incompatibility protein-domain-containing protein [Lasiosphaeria ovina]